MSQYLLIYGQIIQVAYTQQAKMANATQLIIFQPIKVTIDPQAILGVGKPFEICNVVKTVLIMDKNENKISSIFFMWALIQHKLSHGAVFMQGCYKFTFFTHYIAVHCNFGQYNFSQATSFLSLLYYTFRTRNMDTIFFLY